MKNSSSRNIAGIALILFGGLWFLSTTDLFFFDVWDYFWPVFFIAIGVILAVKGRALVIATLFIFFGALNLISNLFYINFDFLFHRYWPLILIAMGLLILFRKKNGRWERRDKRDEFGTGHPFNTDSTGSTPYTDAGDEGKSKSDDKKSESDVNSGTGFGSYGSSNNNYNYYGGDYGLGQKGQNTYDADKIDEVAILTSIRKFITSQNFKGGEVKTILGGGILDFSGAKLAEGENVIELTSIMGGVTFRIPQDWKVIVNVHSIFGGFEDKRRFFPPAATEGSNVLIIKGTVIMGGGTITY